MEDNNKMKEFDEDEKGKIRLGNSIEGYIVMQEGQ